MNKHGSSLAVFGSVSALIGCLNLPALGKLGSSVSVALNIAGLAACFALGWKLTAAAEHNCGQLNVFGLKRSRLLVLSAFGGYANLCTFSIFGGVMQLSGNERVPLPLRMPDTSLSALVCFSVLLYFLTSAKSAGMTASVTTSALGLLLPAIYEVANLRVRGFDTFRLLSSAYVVLLWAVLIRSGSGLIAVNKVSRSPVHDSPDLS